MTQATHYTRTNSFADDERNNAGGRSTVSTADVDAELDAVGTRLNLTIDNLALLQRDDGVMRDSAVPVSALGADTLKLLTTGLSVPRGAWTTATAYAAKDLVTQSGNTYIAVTAHTSGTFATDLAALKWVLFQLGANPAATSIPFAPTANILSATVQAAIAEVDTNSRARDPVNLLTFGGGPGVADNYAAVMLAYNTAPAGTTIKVPAGVYNFLTPPVFGSKQVSWLGDGARQSVWNYAGASTTTDCFTFGDGVTGVIGARIEGIGFTSSTLMTAGTGVHLKGFCRTVLFDVLFGHQDGNSNFWHGVWFDNFDFVTLSGFQCRAQQDGLRYHGGTLGAADLFISGGKIGQCLVGMHAGGNAGGVSVELTDIINNATNVLINQAIVATPNREHFFDSTVAIDTADLTRTASVYNGIGVDIQDTSGLIFFEGTWIATGGTLIRIGATYAGLVKYDGGRLFNALITYGGNGNAVEIAGTSSTVILNGQSFANVQGTAVVCTAGSPNTNVSLRNPSFDTVTNLVSNCTSGSGTDVSMGRIVGAGFKPFASAVDSSPAQTFYQNATGAGGAMAIGYFGANSSNGWIDFCKSRSATLGAHTVVQTNDALGGINFAGSDGTNFISSSRIRAIVRGTPGTNDVASRLEFSTRESSVGTFTARMYLTESGNLIPSTPGTYDLGAASTNYWRGVYAQNVVLALPASATPANNGEFTMQLTSNTSLTFKVKGSDGVVRTASLTLT